MSDTITLTDPATGKTWTSGSRGRKPKWVMDLEAAGTVIPKKEASTTTKVTSTTPLVPGQLRVWRLTGQAGELGDNDIHQQRGHCLIVAADEVGAILVANPTFQNPMIGRRELDIMWTEVEPAMVADIHASGIDCTKQGIYESTGSGWAARKKIA
jgi:hypothetical protein